MFKQISQIRGHDLAYHFKGENFTQSFTCHWQCASDYIWESEKDQ